MQNQWCSKHNRIVNLCLLDHSMQHTCNTQHIIGISSMSIRNIYSDHSGFMPQILFWRLFFKNYSSKCIYSHEWLNFFDFTLKIQLTPSISNLQGTRKFVRDRESWDRERKIGYSLHKGTETLVRDRERFEIEGVRDRESQLYYFLFTE